MKNERAPGSGDIRKEMIKNGGQPPKNSWRIAKKVLHICIQKRDEKRHKKYISGWLLHVLESSIRQDNLGAPAPELTIKIIQEMHDNINYPKQGEYLSKRVITRTSKGLDQIYIPPYVFDIFFKVALKK